MQRIKGWLRRSRLQVHLRCACRSRLTQSCCAPCLSSPSCYLHSFSGHSLRVSGTSSSSCPKTVTIGSSAGNDHKFSFQLFSQNQMFALVNCINFDWTQSICWALMLYHGCSARNLSFISNKGPEWIGASSSSAWWGMYGTDEMEG